MLIKPVGASGHISFHRNTGIMRSAGRSITARNVIAVLLAITVLFAAWFLQPVPVCGMQQSGTAGSTQARRFSMTYVYFGDPAAYYGLVDDAAGALDHIAPSYFDLNDDGTLKITQAIDRDFIDAMHERGISVTPFLSNHWDPDIRMHLLPVNRWPCCWTGCWAAMQTPLVQDITSVLMPAVMRVTAILQIPATTILPVSAIQTRHACGRTAPYAGWQPGASSRVSRTVRSGRMRPSAGARWQCLPKGPSRLLPEMPEMVPVLQVFYTGQRGQNP